MTRVSPDRAKRVSRTFTLRLRVVRIGGLPDLTFKSFEWSLSSNFVCDLTGQPTNRVNGTNFFRARFSERPVATDDAVRGGYEDQAYAP